MEMTESREDLDALKKYLAYWRILLYSVLVAEIKAWSIWIE